MFWVLASLALELLDNLMFLTKAQETSWASAVPAMLSLGRSMGAGLWDLHRSPERHPGFRANLGGQRGAQFSGPRTQCHEAQRMAFKAAFMARSCSSKGTNFRNGIH